MAGRVGEESFRTLFEPHRRSITLHCYRMLGSLQDAEEIAQEALLRGWQRQNEVRSPAATRAWLTSRRGLLSAYRCGKVFPVGRRGKTGSFTWRKEDLDAFLRVEEPASGMLPIA